MLTGLLLAGNHAQYSSMPLSFDSPGPATQSLPNPWQPGLLLDQIECILGVQNEPNPLQPGAPADPNLLHLGPNERKSLQP
ncbi:hypothetical protein DUNSADRAFT_265 [Dunaliella salina]|uniref:Encoded protein n=1 Tax=Dunaliella salina TaxID=3046 RepID=A0ABQ7FZ91_DUNSA|nr:hypothetical protein DUNSADRAFT_265 [Dunaliella salina]|eukprot:KAF5827670.1 hypothetical protein DUNSADRAFT_265 [Dunaliella salina]